MVEPKEETTKYYSVEAFAQSQPHDGDWCSCCLARAVSLVTVCSDHGFEADEAGFFHDICCCPEDCGTNVAAVKYQEHYFQATGYDESGKIIVIDANTSGDKAWLFDIIWRDESVVVRPVEIRETLR